MRMYDCIEKKKQGQALSQGEIQEMITRYMKDEIPDYQMSAFLMAVCFQGMTDEELGYLTDAMEHSGDTVDLSGIDGIKVDKHSTGGVGDKTTLILAPAVAACGVKVVKMSGRGLGFTGGTIDKLEAIPGFRTAIPIREMIPLVNANGVCVVGQSGELAPADKRLYALRDVTATVNSIPLIAASIMSKKLAAGTDCIVLEVTTGSGAFMENLSDAILLSEKMVAIGKQNGRNTSVLITNMDTPLGLTIGNTLEVKEAIEVLQGAGEPGLREVCRELAMDMLHLAGKGDRETCGQMYDEVIANGEAFATFQKMVSAQGGDVTYLTNPKQWPEATYSEEVLAEQDGFINHMNTKEFGVVSCMLGAGRITKDSAIDNTAGIVLNKKTGDSVCMGERLAILYSSTIQDMSEAKKRLLAAYEYSVEKPEHRPHILKRIAGNG